MFDNEVTCVDLTEEELYMLHIAVLYKGPLFIGYSTEGDNNILKVMGSTTVIKTFITRYETLAQLLRPKTFMVTLFCASCKKWQSPASFSHKLTFIVCVKCQAVLI